MPPAGQGRGASQERVKDGASRGARVGTPRAPACSSCPGWGQRGSGVQFRASVQGPSSEGESPLPGFRVGVTPASTVGSSPLSGGSWAGAPGTPPAGGGVCEGPPGASFPGQGAQRGFMPI